jgi:hypothetical protein
MSATTYNKGFGEGAWGFNGFGGIAPAYEVDGVAGTGAVGTVALVYSTSVIPTGVQGTGDVGTTTVSLSDSVVVTGVTGTGSVGTAALQIAVVATGVDGTGDMIGRAAGRA